MRAFTDNDGRQWVISITIGSLKRVRALAGIDLMGIVDPRSGVLERLAADPCVLGDAIFAAIKPAADELEVTGEEFAEALAGDALAAATEAFIEAVVDFFPDARGREALRALMAAGKERSEQIAAAAMEAVDALRTTHGQPSGAPPESSESIPTG